MQVAERVGQPPPLMVESLGGDLAMLADTLR